MGMGLGFCCHCEEPSSTSTPPPSSSSTPPSSSSFSGSTIQPSVGCECCENGIAPRRWSLPAILTNTNHCGGEFGAQIVESQGGACSYGPGLAAPQWNNVDIGNGVGCQYTGSELKVVLQIRKPSPANPCIVELIYFVGESQGVTVNNNVQTAQYSTNNGGAVFDCLSPIELNLAAGLSINDTRLFYFHATGDVAPIGVYAVPETLVITPAP